MNKEVINNTNRQGYSDSETSEEKYEPNDYVDIGEEDEDSEGESEN